MPDPPYDKGDTVRFSVVLTDHFTGSAITASAVALELIRPSGATARYLTGGPSPPTATGFGAYSQDVVIDQSGTWDWRWSASNPATAEQGSFKVPTSRF